MAATKLTCPECGKVLKPAKPLAAGKKVKCPECATVFAAVEDDEQSDTAVTKKTAKTATNAEAKAKPAAVKKAAKAPEGKPKKKKPEKPPSDDSDEDDGPMTYELINRDASHEEPKVDHVPDAKIKDLRGPAQEAVTKPSNAMILLGAICFFSYLAMAFMILIPILFPTPVPKGEDGGAAAAAAMGWRDKRKVTDAAIWAGGSATEFGARKLTEKDKITQSLFTMFGWDLMDVPSYDWWLKALMFLICLLGMIFCGVATFGAVRMQTLESRVWGIVASVLVMFPALSIGLFGVLSMVFTFIMSAIFGDDNGNWADCYWYGIVWGLPAFGAGVGIGIWALTTLMKEEVIAGYEYVTDA